MPSSGHRDGTQFYLLLPLVQSALYSLQVWVILDVNNNLLSAPIFVLKKSTFSFIIIGIPKMRHLSWLHGWVRQALKENY